MRIVFDLQACQAPFSRTRGIGRYTLAHVRAFIELATEHEVLLVLNNSFSETIELVRQDFADILPMDNIRIFSAMGGLTDLSINNQWRHTASQTLYEDFIRALEPDVFHVTSLFEGFNDAVTGIVPNHGGINSVTLYDLIPYQYAETYLPNQSLQDWYFRKMQACKSADLLLAITASSRQEAIDIIGLNEQSVVNISSAIGDHFKVSLVETSRMQELQTKFGLRDNYILYTGGIDSRKNIEGLIKAYALLPIDLRDRHQLAIVCSCDASNRDRLQTLAKAAGLPLGQLVLTGFVTEEELVDLYNLAKLFVFPSLHEGFGLPALEAMACGIPTLVSNTSSLPEVVNRQDMQFNPRDPQAISQAIQQTLGDPERMADLREHGLHQAKMFSWQRTAQVTLEAFEQAFAEKRERAVPVSAPQTPSATGFRPRLAFVSPLPPQESGIADYSAELLPELARYYDIDVITPQQEITDRWVRGNYPCRTPAWFLQNASRYQRVLYHFGNSDFHSHMFQMLERVPGTVVLHDFYLSGILHHLQNIGEQPGCFTQALYQSHGYPALLAFAQDPYASARQYPANFGVLGQAQGVIVHSEHSRTLAGNFYGPHVAKDWACLPLLRVPKQLPDNASAKQQLGLPADSQVTATFGFIAPTKLNLELIEAWLATQQDNPNAWLVLVGRNNPGDYGLQILARIEQSPARSRIKITGFASTEEYNLWLAAADVTVQLRTGSRGETSAALYDCISAGKPLIYNANGSSAELPETVAARLPDAFSPEQLATALLDLLNDASQALRLSEAALAWRERLSPGKVAQQYWHAIEDFAQYHALARQKRLLARLSTLVQHGEQPAGNHIELACAVAQNLNYMQQPCCYIDISGLSESWSEALQTNIATLLREPPEGWRVELVEKDDEQYHLASAQACRLLGIEQIPDQPLLTRANDAWIHIDEILASPLLHARLQRTQLIEQQQLARMTRQSLTIWLNSQRPKGMTHS